MDFKPLHDRILVSRVEAEAKTSGGIIIPEVAKEKPQEGKVIAVGPGRFEKGERIYIEPQPIPGNWMWFIEQGQPVLINTDVARFLQRIEPGFKPPSGLVPKSVLNVPLKMHGQVRGVISLQNVDQESAFSESHQRLLETLAGSMRTPTCFRPEGTLTIYSGSST